jgi:hypothetical protein
MKNYKEVPVCVENNGQIYISQLNEKDADGHYNYRLVDISVELGIAPNKTEDLIVDDDEQFPICDDEICIKAAELEIGKDPKNCTYTIY